MEWIDITTSAPNYYESVLVFLSDDTFELLFYTSEGWQFNTDGRPFVEEEESNIMYWTYLTKPVVL